MSSKITWIFLSFGAIALFFLFTEHRAHLFGWLPFILLAACPLMHLFMHHGGHGHSNHNNTSANQDSAKSQHNHH